MDARNCPRCGKVFTYIRENVCPECYKKEEERFQILKKYIEEYPLCGLKELSEGTEVSVKTIMAYVRDGRLEISKGMRGEFRCEQCGKPIARGRFCDACVIKINQEINTVFTGEGKNAGPRMHTTSKKVL